MEFWFIQNFTRQIDIIKTLGKEEVIGEISVELPISLETILSDKDIQYAKKIHLRGHSSLIREIEKHFVSKGIPVIWE